MSLVVLVGAAAAVGLLLVLLVGGGQRRAPSAPTGASTDDETAMAWIHAHGVAGFERLLLRMFEEMGFQPGPGERTHATVAFFAMDPTPIRGGRIYVHGIFATPGAPVDGDEVRALIDASRAEVAGKAVLVTVGRFSDDAREAARDQAIELVDGEALAELVRKHLPQVHATRTP